MSRTRSRRPGSSGDVEDRALGYAIANLVPEHLAEVKTRRIAEIDKVEREVRARLTREINYWDARAARLREEERAGKEQRINAVRTPRRWPQRLVERLHARQAELDRERQITALPPVLKGAALVIPAGLLRPHALPPDTASRTGFAEDPIARAEIERARHGRRSWRPSATLGHRAARRVGREEGLGYREPNPRAGICALSRSRAGTPTARDVILTKNEILASLNAPEAYFLAIVRIEAGFAHEPVYVAGSFNGNSGFAETAVVFSLADLLSLAAQPV